MATLASQLLSAQNDTNDDRLVELFRNRSALKKEFAKLRRENYRLKEHIQHQEATVLGVERKLEHLEALLADPLQAANAVVFFQLRGIWNLCRKRLSRMAEDLIVKQRELEQKQITDRFESARQASLHKIDSHIAPAEQSAAEIQRQIEAIEQRREQLRGFWNHFKRRSLRFAMEPLAESLNEISAQLGRFKLARKTKESERPPKLEKLSIEGQRKINLALIAVGQELYLHFTQRNIDSMARESSVRKVAEANYGSIGECRELSNLIDRRTQELQAGPELIASVRNRAFFLEKHAHYRSETDLVPVASSFAEIPLKLSDASQPHDRKSIPVNILAEEYWDIFSVLLT